MKKILSLSVSFILILVLSACGAKNLNITSIKASALEMTAGEEKNIELSYNIEEQDYTDEQFINTVDKLEITYSTEDSRIASVDENGLVTAISQGETVIKVTTSDKNLLIDVPITVYPKLKEIQVNDISISINDISKVVSYTLYPEGAKSNVTLETEDESIAVLGKDRTIIPVSVGRTAIVASSEDNSIFGYGWIEVLPAIESITVSNKNITLVEGEDVRIEYDIFPSESIDKVTISSDNENIVKVYQSGQISALDAGTTTVYLTSGDVSTAITVTVKPKKSAATFWTGGYNIANDWQNIEIEH